MVPEAFPCAPGPRHTIEPGDADGFHEHSKQNGRPRREGVQQGQHIHPALGVEGESLRPFLGGMRPEMATDYHIRPLSHWLRTLLAKASVSILGLLS